MERGQNLGCTGSIAYPEPPREAVTVHVGSIPLWVGSTTPKIALARRQSAMRSPKLVRAAPEHFSVGVEGRLDL